MTWLLMVNALLALASGMFGLIALWRPTLLSGEPEHSPYYVQMYAARAVPFGLGMAVVACWLPTQAFVWLLVAGVIQGVDAVIGLRRMIPAAVIAPICAAVIHFFTAWWLM